MIVSLWVGRRGAPSKVGFDHVGDDGTRLGEVEGGDGGLVGLRGVLGFARVDLHLAALPWRVVRHSAR